MALKWKIALEALREHVSVADLASSIFRAVDQATAPVSESWG
ncbi:MULTISPECIES: hypothetical protein [Bradyrhizobium]|nr:MULTISPECIES: hypothetical protein [Bradyrhizobium]